MLFCDKGMAVPQINFAFFLACKQSVWPFFCPLFSIVWLCTKIFIWQPWSVGQFGVLLPQRKPKLARTKPSTGPYADCGLDIAVLNWTVAVFEHLRVECQDWPAGWLSLCWSDISSSASCAQDKIQLKRLHVETVNHRKQLLMRT